MVFRYCARVLVQVRNDAGTKRWRHAVLRREDLVNLRSRNVNCLRGTAGSGELSMWYAGGLVRYSASMVSKLSMLRE